MSDHYKLPADHVWVVAFDQGDTTTEYLRCLNTGPERPCAVINCPVDHEDVSRACITEHGAEALDRCWAVEWAETDRESVDTEDLGEVYVAVRVGFDEGVVLYRCRA